MEVDATIWVLGGIAALFIPLVAWVYLDDRKRTSDRLNKHSKEISDLQAMSTELAEIRRDVHWIRKALERSN
jgi:beta-lactamase regulating signal transducer with metallopeptidase domain